MTDLKISQLNALDGVQVAAADELPIVDASASETKRVTAEGLVSAGVRLLPNASIAWGKIDASAIALPANSIGATQLSSGSVQTDKIADLAVTNAKIQGPITADKFGAQAASVVLAGPATGVASAPSFRALLATDLPIATTSARGAVSVNTGSGLAIDAAGQIGLDPTTAADTKPVVTYNQYGRILTGRDLTAADLPIATNAAVGAIKVGTGLSVDSAGLLNVKLLATDVPGLDAAAIVSGTLDPMRIANRSITNQMLANNAVSYIQEASPSASGQCVGALWLQESTGQLRMWNGNSWFPVGFGRLSAENLRYCGTFNAATGQISGVTQFGAQEGFVIGDSLPVASDSKSGVYFVCATPGSGAAVAAGVTFDNGDWIVCNGAVAGWVRIDTLSGGGGGGGATNLSGLLDVTLVAPVDGDQLVFSANGQWVNKTPAASSATAVGLVQLATQAEVDAGTNALKAVTPKTLQDAVLNCGVY
jgi:hypothetical protein